MAAAVELARRGALVTVIDPGPIPHPLAESTDISKAVRIEYGDDDGYATAMERALEGWQRWNEAWPAPLFHETGMAFLSRAPISEDSFEGASLTTLARRGHALERLDARAIRRRFPAWNAEVYVDGIFNPRDGFAESGAVVGALAAEVASLGATFVRARADRVNFEGARVTGVALHDGVVVASDELVLANGAWAADLCPALAPLVRGVGQPVFHLAPASPDAFRAEVFPTFGADIARTGYYGFPLHAGVVKIANHGVGRPLHPSASDRRVTAEQRAHFRAFLAESIPSLADAPIVHERVCVYGDTPDEHFLIARVPDTSGLLVATGGSGHAFKFAPLLGGWIADALDGIGHAWTDRFAWRTATGRPEEQARSRT